MINKFKKYLSLLLFGIVINLFSAEDKNIYNVVIIGSGPAGLTAAGCAARSKLKPLVIEGDYPGGQLARANYIKNWPATKSILGTDLVKSMRDRAEQLGAEFRPGYVYQVNLSKKPFTLTVDDDKIYAHSIIVATGAKPTRLGCPGEEGYLGKGVAVCARCDGPLFKNKSVVVIGGNHFALREIDLLTKFAKKITIINKNPEITGFWKLVKKIKDSPKIEIMNNCEAIEILGNNNWVTGVKILNHNNKEKEVIPAQGVFVAIGWQPDSEIFKGQLARDSKGQIKIKNDTNTSVDGVFSAGDVTIKARHQALPASGYGYMAAMDAEKYLRKKQDLQI